MSRIGFVCRFIILGLWLWVKAKYSYGSCTTATVLFLVFKNVSMGHVPVGMMLSISPYSCPVFGHDFGVFVCEDSSHLSPT